MKSGIALGDMMEGGVLTRSQFVAAVASRLPMLPDPMPCLAVFVVSLPDMPSFRQAWGRASTEVLWHSIVHSIEDAFPDTPICRLDTDQVALCCEFDPEWTELVDMAQDIKGAVRYSGAGGISHFVQMPMIGAVVHDGHKSRGMLIETASELLRQAALCSHMAQRHGSDNFLLHSSRFDDVLKRAAMLDISMRRALTQREFSVQYQPMVDLVSSRIVGLEGLIRWKTPSGSFIQPDEFIPAAEMNGMIVEIGAYVMESAMRQVDRWIGERHISPRVSVNVAAPQLIDAAFPKTVANALAIGSVGPCNLELEITERTLISPTRSTIEFLRTLRSKGVTIALDDFGTGYSSLQYLRDMPVDKIKIDKAFVTNIATDQRDQALVRTIVGMADAFGMSVLAEGIETDDQLRVLLSCGCNTGQGYLFSRAVPAERIDFGLDVVDPTAPLRSVPTHTEIS